MSLTCLIRGHRNKWVLKGGFLGVDDAVLARCAVCNKIYEVKR